MRFCELNGSGEIAIAIGIILAKRKGGIIQICSDTLRSCDVVVVIAVVMLVGTEAVAVGREILLVAEVIIVVVVVVVSG